jgi:glycosyltransferase involved in cell wall biosynthesis
MNILLVGRYEQRKVLTGPQKYSLRLFEELKKTHAVTFVMYFRDGKIYSRWSKIFGYELIEQDQTSRIVRCGLIPFAFILLQKQFTIVHIISFERFAIVAALLRLIRRYKLVYTCHGVITFEYRNFYQHIQKRIRTTGQWIEKKFFQCADCIVYVSAYEMKLAKAEGLRPVRYQIIHNGVETIFCAQEKVHAVKKMNSLIFVGNIQRKEKGYSFLVDVLKKYEREIEVTIVSEDEIHEGSLHANKVVWMKPMDAETLAQVFQNHDIFISASVYDPFSLAAAEAMASGAVPIVTRTTGISELISHGINGFIVDYGDSDGLCHILSLLQDDRNLLKTISKNAQTTIAKRTWSHVVKEYNNMYQCL